MENKSDNFWQAVLIFGGVLLGIKALQALTARSEPCPSCRAPVREGVTPCPRCGAVLQWVEAERT